MHCASVSSIWSTFRVFRQGASDPSEQLFWLSVSACSSWLFTWGLLVQVIEDLREECSKYGQVLKVVVPRPPVPQQAYTLFNQQNYGKVCVKQ